MAHTVWGYWVVIYWFSEMKISQRNVKANANLHTLIVQCLALTQTASLNVEEFLMIALTVGRSRTYS